MQEEQNEVTSVNASTVRMDLRDLQRETILLVTPGLYIAAILFVLIGVVSDGRTDMVWPANGLVLLSALVWFLHSRSYLMAAWTLVSGLVLIDLLTITVGGMATAICLLALPVGLAAVYISVPAGVGAAIAATVLLLLAPGTVMPDATLRIVGLIQLWGTAGMMALAARPLLTAAEWAWSSYEQSRNLLNQARDYQVQLKQTLEDLADANEQLTRLNQFARVMREAAEEARRAKERFVANVSHELRTPLNMIIGFSELILSSPESYGANIPPALLTDLQVILRNSRHLSSLIDDVLDLSQIEAGRMALTKEYIDLAEVIDAAVSAVRRLFQSKGLYLETRVPADLPPILCDRTRIREVILNLLSNAARFTDKGGVRLCVTREGNDVIVSVADTGPGIAREQIDRLFQPFEQLDGSIRHRHGGSGLGLSISKAFVELHGGSMWIESTPGHGSTVSFRLPITSPMPLQGGAVRWLQPEWEFRQRTRPSLVPPTTVRPRLVIVENGNALRRLLVRYLDNADIIPATNLAEGLREVTRTSTQALIINDMLVGHTFQQLLSAGTLPSGTPAIICSIPEISNVAEALGVADYLIKPVTRDQLLATLDRLQLAGKTILIVDDEPEAIRLFVRMLRSAERGYHVLTASNGKAALRILRKHKPDAMLLDLIMPDMDGFRLLTTVRHDAALKDMTILVISARDPMGHPIVSSALAVTKQDGLSTQQLLACIDALCTILSPGSRPGDPRRPENPAD